jgi:hypothetical protein
MSVSEGKVATIHMHEVGFGFANVGVTAEESDVGHFSLRLSKQPRDVIFGNVELAAYRAVRFNTHGYQYRSLFLQEAKIGFRSRQYMK